MGCARGHLRPDRVERTVRRDRIRVADRASAPTRRRRTKSRSARAALRSTSELSLLLAGSQLGITACTLALGATTKPAVHHWLTPLLQATGAPTWVADAGGFVLALAIVTFLHLVIGEMAPKSWAIAHPERAATILAIPMRMFMALTRPVLIALNRAANWCVRKAGVDPIDELGEGQDPETLRHLVEHSAAAGALDPRYYRNLATALELEKLTVGDIVSRTSSLSTVSADAGPAAIQAMSRLTGHQRILVSGDDQAARAWCMCATASAPTPKPRRAT